MRAALVVGLIVLAGCGKKPATEEEPSGSPSTPRANDVTPISRRGYPERLTAKEMKRGPLVVELLSVLPMSSEHLVIQFGIRITDPSKNLQFTSWEGSRKNKLVDDKGNNYQQIPLGYNLRKEFEKAIQESSAANNLGTGTGALRADLGRIDWVGFQSPTLTAQYIDLDLDGANVGEKDPILFRIPRARWAEKR